MSVVCHSLCSFFLQHCSTCSSSTACSHLCQSHQHLHKLFFSDFSSFSKLSASQTDSVYITSPSFIYVTSVFLQFMYPLMLPHPQTREQPQALCLKFVSLAASFFRTSTFYFLNFLNKFIYFIYLFFWLHWGFVAAHGLSLVAASGGYSSLHCTCFSLWWLLLLQTMGSRHVGFSRCGTKAQ